MAENDSEICPERGAAVGGLLVPVVTLMGSIGLGSRTIYCFIYCIYSLVNCIVLMR